MRIATFQIYWVIGPHVRNGKLMYQPTLWTLNAIITIPSPLLCNQICSRRWRPSEECKCPHTHIHIYTHSLALWRNAQSPTRPSIDHILVHFPTSEQGGLNRGARDRGRATSEQEDLDFSIFRLVSPTLLQNTADSLLIPTSGSWVGVVRRGQGRGERLHATLRAVQLLECILDSLWGSRDRK